MRCCLPSLSISLETAAPTAEPTFAKTFWKKTETLFILVRLQPPIHAATFHLATLPLPGECRLRFPPAGASHPVAQVKSRVRHWPPASEPRRSTQEELMRDTLRTCCLLWRLPPPPPSLSHTHTRRQGVVKDAMCVQVSGCAAAPFTCHNGSNQFIPANRPAASAAARVLYRSNESNGACYSGNNTLITMKPIC